jgi:hypothetical protein
VPSPTQRIVNFLHSQGCSNVVVETVDVTTINYTTPNAMHGLLVITSRGVKEYLGLANSHAVDMELLATHHSYDSLVAAWK